MLSMSLYPPFLSALPQERYIKLIGNDALGCWALCNSVALGMIKKFIVHLYSVLKSELLIEGWYRQKRSAMVRLGSHFHSEVLNMVFRGLTKVRLMMLRGGCDGQVSHS